MDLKLYVTSGGYARLGYEELGYSTLSSKTATRLETIAGKVVRFLLTTLGSDALDPEYGGYLRTYTRIPESLLPKVGIEIRQDIARCQKYIKKHESNLDRSEEALARIVLQDIKYNKQVSPPAVDIYIQVHTTLGNTAMLAVSVD